MFICLLNGLDGKDFEMKEFENYEGRSIAKNGLQVRESYEAKSKLFGTVPFGRKFSIRKEYTKPIKINGRAEDGFSFRHILNSLMQREIPGQRSKAGLSREILVKPTIN